MDKRTFLRLILILSSIPVCSRISPAQTPQSFFPSEVGNLWQYRYDSGAPYSWRITRDSVDVDSSQYLFGVVNNSGEFLRYKVDTMARVYTSPPWWNYHDYKLDADTGEAWVWYNNGYHDFYAWLYAITSYPVFGMTETVKIFRFGPMHPDSGGNGYYYTEQHLASDFGLVFETGEPSYALFLQGCVISGDTFGIVVSTPVDGSVLPEEVVLHQNYPNPFNPITTISFSLPHSGDVSLKIYNLLGEEVATLVSGPMEAGTHSVKWNATGQPSGVYFCRLRAEEFVETKKLLLLK